MKYKDFFIRRESFGLQHSMIFGHRNIVYPLAICTITPVRNIYLLDLHNLFQKYGDSFKLKLALLLQDGTLFFDNDIMEYFNGIKLGFKKYTITYRYHLPRFKKTNLCNEELIGALYVEQFVFSGKGYNKHGDDIKMDSFILDKLYNKKLPGESLLKQFALNLDYLRRYYHKRKKDFSYYSNIPKYYINDRNLGLISLILTLRLCKERNKNYLRI